MFKLTSNPRFKHVVKIQVPVDGGFDEQSLKVEFRVIDVADIGDTGDLEGQQVFLREVVCGWEDLVDDQKQQIGYTDELREQLIATPYVRLAMMAAYVAAVTKTKSGN